MIKLFTCFFFIVAVNAYVDFVPEVADFTGIALTGPFVVRINIKENFSVRVTADLDDVNISEFVTITSENDTLTISPAASSLRPEETSSLFHIYVNARSVSNLILNGSGSLIVDSLVSSPSVNILNNGSGNISLKVDSKSLNVVLNGAGTVEARGKADTASILLSAPGKALMSKLECGSVSVGMLAAGEVALDVHDTVSVIQTAPGSVTFSGEAKLNVMKLGVGSIVGLGGSASPAATAVPTSVLGFAASGPARRVFWSSVRKNGKLFEKDQELAGDAKVAVPPPVAKDIGDPKAPVAVLVPKDVKDQTVVPAGKSGGAGLVVAKNLMKLT